MVTTDGRELTAEERDEARRYSMVIAWSPEDEVYVASFPEFPVARTHGSTVAEAAEMGEEVIASLLALRSVDGLAAPVAPRTARRFVVDPPPQYDPTRILSVRNDLNLSQSLLAAVLNVSDSTVQSWEQGVKRPEGAALRLLDLVETYPGIIERLISAKDTDPKATGSPVAVHSEPDSAR